MTGKLIGIVGHMGAGKTTTVAQAATTLSNFSWRLMGFSDPFQPMLEACGIPLFVYLDKSRWNEPLDALCGKTLRQATRSLGQTWGRECIGDDFWTRIALRKAESERLRNRHVIIDNVRYPSEFEALDQAGGIMIAFHRPGLEPDLSHVSEQHIAELQTWCHHRFEHREPFMQSNTRFAELLTEIIR